MPAFENGAPGPVWDNDAMNDPQPTSPRRRLQELLAIPERERTDAQWDEINELEISLASGNREDIPDQAARQRPLGAGGHARPGGGAQGKKPFKKFHKKPSRGNAP